MKCDYCGHTIRELNYTAVTESADGVLIKVDHYHSDQCYDKAMIKQAVDCYDMVERF